MHKRLVDDARRTVMAFLLDQGCMGDPAAVDLRDSFLEIMEAIDEAQAPLHDRTFVLLSDVRNVFVDPDHPTNRLC